MARRSIFSLFGSAVLCCASLAGLSSAAAGATGVCCIPGLTCAIADSTICQGAGGVYKGDNTTCTPTNPCELPRGACCIARSALTPPPYTTGGLPSVAPTVVPIQVISTAGPFTFGQPEIICAVLTQIGCTSNGGTYHGDNSPCTPTLCAPASTILGACCRVPVGSSPTCQSSTQAQCAIGLWTANQTCAAVTCNPPTGACCRTDYCAVLTEIACNATHAAYKGDGSVCNTTTCPPPILGTCCRPGSATQGLACEVTFNINCLTPSIFSNAQTTCVSVACPGECPCDWNHDGYVNASDLVAFQSDFFAGHADFDHNNTTNAADYTAFLQCYNSPTAQCIHR